MGRFGLLFPSRDIPEFCFYALMSVYLYLHAYSVRINIPSILTTTTRRLYIYLYAVSMLSMLSVLSMLSMLSMLTVEMRPPLHVVYTVFRQPFPIDGRDTPLDQEDDT